MKILINFLLGVSLGFIFCSNVYPQRTFADHLRAYDKAVLDYQNGNYQEAIAFFKISAHSGVRASAHAMGFVYEDGLAFPRNYQLAFKYFECASEMGYFRSQARLATYYVEGNGVQKNLEKAYFWLLLAASNEIPEVDSLGAVKTIRDSVEKRLSFESKKRIQQEALKWNQKKLECNFK